MTITTELVIARHGEAVCNTLGIVGGDRGCTGLTDTGRHQVQRLAERLAQEHADRPFDVLCATPRLRVRQSVEIVSAALDLSYQTEEDLRGPDHGDADGRPWSEVKAAFGGPAQHDPDRPYAIGSETWNQYLARAARTLAKVIDCHEGKRILIIAHGETIDAAHNLLLNLPPGTCTSVGFWTDHTGISRWQKQVNRFGRKAWVLVSHNGTRHLP